MLPCNHSLPKMLLALKMEKNKYIIFKLHLKVSFIHSCITAAFFITAAIFSSFSAHWSLEDAKTVNHNQPIYSWLLGFLGEENNLPSELPGETTSLVFDDDSVSLSPCLTDKIYTNSYGFDKQYLLLNKSVASLFKPELSTPPPKI